MNGLRIRTEESREPGARVGVGFVSHHEKKVEGHSTVQVALSKKICQRPYAV